MVAELPAHQKQVALGLFPLVLFTVERVTKFILCRVMKYSVIQVPTLAGLLVSALVGSCTAY
jgi:hypothetical protein